MSTRSFTIEEDRELRVLVAQEAALERNEPRRRTLLQISAKLASTIQEAERIQASNYLPHHCCHGGCRC